MPMGRRPWKPAALRRRMLAMRVSAGAMPDHALGQQRLEREHALAVGLEQTLDRNVGELGHHFGDALRVTLARRAAPRRAPARSRIESALSGSTRPGR